MNISSITVPPTSADVPRGYIESFDGTHISGWAADGSEQALRVLVYFNGDLYCEIVPEIWRADVAAAGHAAANAGFHLPVPPRFFATAACKVQLVDGGTGVELLRPPFTISALPILRATQAGGAARFGPNDFLWPPPERLVSIEASDSSSQAFVEGAICLSNGTGGVVYGWALHDPARDLGIALQDGTRVPFSSFFRAKRQDVSAAFPQSTWRSCECGFVGFVPGLRSEQTFSVVEGDGSDARQLLTYQPSVVFKGGIVEIARQLFGIATPLVSFAERSLLVDWHILNAAINSQRQLAVRSSVERAVIGTPAVEPRVSLIIPLYARLDFLEAQIAEFARDIALKNIAEVIYVVDDPSLWNTALARCRDLCRLYSFSVVLVGGDVNRGFSGANNLGTAASRGDLLLFLNSDVIPIETGWLTNLTAAWDTAKNPGAIGAQLVYPDGGLQHAGMAFRKDQDFNVWINVHPGRGLPPLLDEGPSVQEVPAITGACLLTSREQLAEVGGWDEGYLVGDFEDSHLCLALQSAGRHNYYVRSVCLVHLERQSFRSLGSDDFRQRVVIANAARHQAMWSDVLAGTNSP